MFPRPQTTQVSGGGENQAGLYQDISTRTQQSVRVGEGAGKVATGTGNCFVGYDAGKQSSGTSYSCMLGYQAGAQTAEGSYATFLGAYAGAQCQRGSEVTFAGFRCGELSREGSQLVGIGAYALRENVSGNGSVAVGYRTCERTLDGYNNTAVGAESCQDLRSGNANTAMGYRAGRSAFMSSENCYFGAYSGYSNSGDGNCLMGYKSGEQLVSGSYNVAIGAFSMHTGRGSSNVAIGPFAGGSASTAVGEASENVIIGTHVAAAAAPQRSVVIGALAGSQVTGTGCVVLGYETGQTLRSGSCNILIGLGADTLRGSTTNGISIGNAVRTSTHSIGLGNRITNQRDYSVLMGSDLASDADNSVVIGNHSTIQSVLLWKDPLSYPLVDAVLADGRLKVGLCNAAYGQVLASPCNQVYGHAYAGMFASNAINSSRNPRLSSPLPPSYDLRQAVDTHLVYAPTALAVWSPAELGKQVTATDFIISSNIILQLTGAADRAHVASNLLLRPEDCNVSIESTPPGTTYVENVRRFDQTQSDLPLCVAVRTTIPVASSTCQQVVVPGTMLSAASSGLTLDELDWTLTYDADRVHIPTTQSTYVVAQQPMWGHLDDAIYSGTPLLQYKPYPESGFAAHDTFVMRPMHTIVDDAGHSHSIPAAADINVQIAFVPPESTAFHCTDEVLWTQSHTLGALDIVELPDQTLAGSNAAVLFDSITSGVSVTHNGVTYTSNDVSLMNSENVYAYPPESLGENVAAIGTHLEHAAISCNLDTAVALAGTVLAGMQLDLAIMVAQSFSGDDAYAQAQAATLLGIRADLSNLGVAAVSFDDGAAEAYTAASNNLSAWLSANDSNYVEYAPFTQRLASSNLEFGAAYFDSLLWESWSNMRQLSLAITAPGATLSGLMGQASHFHDTVLPRYTLLDAHQAASTVYPSLAHLHRMYNELPRLFVTYNDILQGNCTLVRSTDAASNAHMDAVTLRTKKPDSAVTAPQTIQLRDARTQAVADGVPSSLAVTLSQPLSSSALPSVAFDAFVVSRLPSNGVLSYSVNASNLQHVTYHPFAGLPDTFEVVVTRQGRSADIRVDVDAVRSPLIATPLTVPAYPVSTTPATVTQAVTRQLQTPVAVCNITDVWETVNDVALPRQLHYSVIEEYDPFVGYTMTTCNIWTCNAVLQTPSTIPGAGMVTLHTHLEHSVASYHELTGLTTQHADGTASVATSVPVPNTSDPSQDCNVYLWDRRTVTGSNLYARTTTVTVYDRAITTTRHMDRVTGGYVYEVTSDTSIDPPVSNVQINVAQTATPYDEWSNVSLLSNIEVQSVYVPLDSISFTGSGPVQLDTETLSPFEIVASNVGPVDALHPSPGAPPYMVRAPGHHSSVTTQLSHCNTTTMWNVAAIPSALPTHITAAQSVQVMVDGGTMRAPAQQMLHDMAGHVGYAFTSATTAHVLGVHGGRIVQDSSNIVTAVRAGDAARVAYLPDRRAPSGSLTVFFDDGAGSNASPIVTATIHPTLAPAANGQWWNTGVGRRSYLDTRLSSNAFFHSDGGAELSNMVVELQSVHPSIRITDGETSLQSFSVQDVADGRVNVFFNQTTNQSGFSYALRDVTDASNVRNLGIHTFPVASYRHMSLPQPATVAGSAVRAQRIGADAFSNVLHGSLWSELAVLYRQGVAVPASNVGIHLTSVPAHGHLWSGGRIVRRSVTLQDLYDGRVHYVPHTPGVLPNDFIACRVSIAGDNEDESWLSPQYQLAWHNYHAPTQPFVAVPTSSALPRLRTYTLPSVSEGMAQHGLGWSSSSVALPRETSNLQVLTQLPVSIVSSPPTGSNAWEGLLNVRRYTTYGALSMKHVGGDAIELQVDESDSTGFASLSNALTGDADGYVYVTAAPSHGVIHSRLDGIARACFPETEFLDGNVVYQHLGDGSLADEFSVAVGGGPYALAEGELTVRISVRPLPVLASNAVAYVYASSAHAASNTTHSLAPYIAAEARHNASRMHCLALCNVEVLPGVSLPLSNLPGAGFRLPPSLVAATPPYPLFGFDYTINNVPDPGYVNPLAQLPQYTRMFRHSFVGRLNHHVDSNIVLAHIDPVQRIAYTFGSTSELFADRTVSVDMLVQPSPTHFHTQSPFLRHPVFGVSFQALDDTVLLSVDFGQDGMWRVSMPGHAPVQGASAGVLVPYEWGKLRIVNRDPSNHGNLSVYVGTAELLQSAGSNLPPFDMDHMRAMTVSAPTDPSHMITSNVVMSMADGVAASFELHNSFGAMLFRDIELVISTYKIDDSTSYDSNTHNVVLGKSILVRGTDNICVGNTFATSGQRSIILGNEIGVSPATGSSTLNDIYQSIVIGNKCFRNSLVRDVICIGNENLNDLAGVDVGDVQSFLASKPIVIGNSIDNAMIAYHLNIDNAFLKTNVGGPQIYVGHGGEPVGVGYTSNAHLSPDHVMHVAGSLCAHRVACAATTQSRVSEEEDLLVGEVVIEVPAPGDAVARTSVQAHPLVSGVVLDMGLHWVQVQVSGRALVWCGSSVAVGELLCTSTIPGVAMGVGAGPGATVVHSYTFAKALASWDAVDPGATPDVQVREHESGALVALVTCLLL